MGRGFLAGVMASVGASGPFAFGVQKKSCRASYLGLGGLLHRFGTKKPARAGWLLRLLRLWFRRWLLWLFFGLLF